MKCTPKTQFIFCLKNASKPERKNKTVLSHLCAGHDGLSGEVHRLLAGPTPESDGENCHTYDAVAQCNDSTSTQPGRTHT
jgi:hypothetical protein